MGGGGGRGEVGRSGCCGESWRVLVCGRGAYVSVSEVRENRAQDVQD